MFAAGVMTVYALILFADSQFFSLFHLWLEFVFFLNSDFSPSRSLGLFSALSLSQCVCLPLYFHFLSPFSKLKRGFNTHTHTFELDRGRDLALLFKRRTIDLGLETEKCVVTISIPLHSEPLSVCVSSNHCVYSTLSPSTQPKQGSNSDAIWTRINVTCELQIIMRLPSDWSGFKPRCYITNWSDLQLLDHVCIVVLLL